MVKLLAARGVRTWLHNTTRTVENELNMLTTAAENRRECSHRKSNKFLLPVIWTAPSAPASTSPTFLRSINQNTYILVHNFGVSTSSHGAVWPRSDKETVLPCFESTL